MNLYKILDEDNYLSDSSNNEDFQRRNEFAAKLNKRMINLDEFLQNVNVLGKKKKDKEKLKFLFGVNL